MGLFDVFNANKKKWMIILESSDFDSQLKVIIRDFFIRDNIIVEIYLENQKANETTKFGNGGLENWEDANNISMNSEPPILCSKTFKQHFSNNRLNRGLQTPDWFYIAYPDVAHWLCKHEPYSRRPHTEMRTCACICIIGSRAHSKYSSTNATCA